MSARRLALPCRRDAAAAVTARVGCPSQAQASTTRLAVARTLAGLAALLSVGTFAQTDGFERDAVGAAPAGWRCGVTGRGQPHWAVAADPAAPSPSKVLLQDRTGTFP